MLDIIAFDVNGKSIENLQIEDLKQEEVKWFWVDFNNPSEEEIALLRDYFHFHPLTIEDCTQSLQRPKVDSYKDYYFFIFHALSESEVEEVNLYLGENYVVTFHFREDLKEIQEVKKSLFNKEISWEKNNAYITYLVLNRIVDEYFPLVYGIEDELDEFDNITYSSFTKNFLDKLYVIRAVLLKLRRTITSMGDLLYRIINSTQLKDILENEMYYENIYDHLLKQTEMIEAARDITSDMQDNYMSIQSNRMNSIMTTLTIITAIFIPLTFIAGIYGMNFVNMPELKWHFGYFIILGVMVFIALEMFIWFKKKGWLDFYK